MVLCKWHESDSAHVWGCFDAWRTWPSALHGVFDWTVDLDAVKDNGSGRCQWQWTWALSNPSEEEGIVPKDGANCAEEGDSDEFWVVGVEGSAYNCLQALWALRNSRCVLGRNVSSVELPEAWGDLDKASLVDESDDAYGRSDRSRVRCAGGVRGRGRSCVVWLDHSSVSWMKDHVPRFDKWWQLVWDPRLWASSIAKACMMFPGKPCFAGCSIDVVWFKASLLSVVKTFAQSIWNDDSHMRSSAEVVTAVRTHVSAKSRRGERGCSEMPQQLHLLRSRFLGMLCTSCRTISEMWVCIRSNGS